MIGDFQPSSVFPRVRPIFLVLAVAGMSGCATAPYQSGFSQASTSTGLKDSDDRAAATTAPSAGDPSRPTRSASSSNAPWGAYSGRRGQTEPPDTGNYPYRGEQVSGTFAADTKL
jgi:hypothetical protein